MKQYSASVVRERFSEALDEAERGVPVFIERRGIRYRLSVEPPAPSRKTKRKPLIEVIDTEAIEHGWTWDLTRTGLRFRRRKPRS